jgi:hypothetical protein
MMAGWVLCVLLALAHPARTQDEEDDPYAKANPELGQKVKARLKLSTDVTFERISFREPRIKGLKGSYGARFTTANGSWRVVRLATDYGDYLQVEKEDGRGTFKFTRVGERIHCAKTGITNEDVKQLLDNVK